MIAYIFRFHPVILAKKILNEKKIGKSLYFRGNFLNFFQIGIRMKIIESFIWPKKNKAVAILDQCHIMDLSLISLMEISKMFYVLIQKNHLFRYKLMTLVK